MASIEIRIWANNQRRQQTNKQERQKAKKQTKGAVCGRQMQVWIQCSQHHCVEVWTTHQQVRLMHRHVSKRVKMHRKPTNGTNKHGKHIIAWSEKGEVCTKQPASWQCNPKWLHLNNASWASDVTTQPQTCYGRQTWQSLELERLT